MVHLIPGDAALAILGERATEEALTELRKDMGLDKPFHEQYGVFLWDLAHFDFGRSFKTKQTVVDEIKRYFPATVELTLAAMGFSIVFGVGTGIIAAVNRGKFWDYTTMFGSLAGISMPIYAVLAGIDADFAVGLHLSHLPKLAETQYHIRPRHRAHNTFYLIDTLLAGTSLHFGTPFGTSSCLR